MSITLCVGNLAENVTHADLVRLFSPFGKVEEAEVCADAATGRTRGFGFVRMASPAEAEAAIRGLNGVTYADRTLSVDQDHRGPRPGEFGDRGGESPCESSNNYGSQ